MSTRRTIRVSEIIRKELANLIARTRTLEGQIITISSVETAPDMRNAFIYVSVLETEVPREKTMAELVKHRRQWQRELGQHLQSKFTPALQFRFDDSIERGDRVMEILTDLNLPIGDKLSPLPPVLTEEEEHEARGDEPHQPKP